jgi:hypothetical protein
MIENLGAFGVCDTIAESVPEIVAVATAAN